MHYFFLMYASLQHNSAHVKFAHVEKKPFRFQVVQASKYLLEWIADFKVGMLCMIVIKNK